MNATVHRDERTVSVENQSYRWAYFVLSYGLLASVAYRGFVLDEQSWDLIGLVIVAGAIATLYQGKESVLNRRWLLLSALAAAVALILAVALVAVR
jgi:hypothetical protein